MQCTLWIRFPIYENETKKECLKFDSMKRFHENIRISPAKNRFSTQLFTLHTPFLQVSEFPSISVHWVRCNFKCLQWRMSGKCTVCWVKLLKSPVLLLFAAAARLCKMSRGKKVNAEKPTSTEIRFDLVDQFERWYALGNIIFPLVRPIHKHTYYTYKRKGNDVKSFFFTEFGQFSVVSPETEPFWTEKIIERKLNKIDIFCVEKRTDAWI